MSRLKHIPKKFKMNLLVNCFSDIRKLVSEGAAFNEATECVYYEAWKELNKWRLGAMYASFRAEDEANKEWTFNDFCSSQWELEGSIFFQIMYN